MHLRIAQHPLIIVKLYELRIQKQIVLCKAEISEITTDPTTNVRRIRLIGIT